MGEKLILLIIGEDRDYGMKISDNIKYRVVWSKNALKFGLQFKIKYIEKKRKHSTIKRNI